MHGKQERDTVLLQAPAALLGSHRSIRRADTTLTWKGGCENMPAGDNKPRPTNIIWSDNKNSSYKKKNKSCKCNGMQGELNFCYLHTHIPPSLPPQQRDKFCSNTLTPEGIGVGLNTTAGSQL